MIERPAFRPQYGLYCLGGGGILLMSERRHVRAAGAIYPKIAPLLDGVRNADEIASELRDEASAAEVYYAIMQLEKLELLAETPALSQKPSAFPSAAAWADSEAPDHTREATVDIRTVPEGLDATVAAQLRSLGLSHDSESEIGLVLVDDYLRSGLEEINEVMLRQRRSWLLAKPVGTVLYVGPFFMPYETACWLCLAHRLRHNRPIHGALQRLAGGEPPLPPPRPSPPSPPK